jgi:hypothetical protein
MPRTAKRKSETVDSSDPTSFAHAAKAAHMLVPSPNGLPNAQTMMRQRGEREDLDCINDVCGRIARGTLVTVAVVEVGVHWALWHKWQYENYLNARDRYKLAYQMHLEVMADRTQQMVEQLEAERKACKQRYYDAHREWREWSGDKDDPKRPREPIYEGPEEWELNAVKEKLRGLYAHMKAGLKRFKDKTQVDHNITERRSIVHEVDIKNVGTAEEVLREYHKLIEGKAE